MGNFLIKTISIAMLFLLASCANTHLETCPSVTTTRIDGVTTQVYENYQPRSERVFKDFKNNYRPTTEQVKKAFEKGLKQYPHKMNPLFIQSAGFVTLDQDTVIVINKIFKKPERSLDYCQFLIGLGSYFEDYTFRYSYNISSDKIDIGYM